MQGFTRKLTFAGVLALAFAAVPASAQTPEQYYRNRQVTMLIASGVGGGYDAYARAFARHIGRHIPGNPTIVPRNVPGAGGLAGTSMLYNNSARDGSVFAALTNGIAMDPLFGTSANRFDAMRLNWLGSIGKLESICVTWHESPIRSIEQARTQEIVVGSAGATSNTGMMPRVVNEFIGTRFRVVGGYTEGTGTTLALENGEIQGICGISYTTLKAARPTWFRDNQLNVILQIGLRKLPDLPGVPNLLDLMTDEEDKRVLELILVRQEMGRPFAMPPETPAGRVAALRRAFDATVRDPAFLAEAARLQLEVDPLTGAEIETLLRAAYAAPRPIVERAARLVGPLN